MFASVRSLCSVFLKTICMRRQFASCALSLVYILVTMFQCGLLSRDGLKISERLPQRLKRSQWVNRRQLRMATNRDHVWDAVLTSPIRSGKKHAQSFVISRRSFQRMVSDMHFHPYKLVISEEELKATDYATSLHFAQRMKAELMNGGVLHKSLIISNETHFHLCEMVNKQNCRYYAGSNPESIVEKPLHSKQVTVWCGAVEWGKVRPYFFKAPVNTEC